ncbi:hypothetical protein [Zhihengliuella sp.]|uniref:hypothetical protein n=1 Tax=Zhihengliuella sp. TaxID=1954483 RepID=UPI00281141BC|nr:hypothetical protein [Zhihengliuella sp.]
MTKRITDRDHYLQEANEAAAQAIARELGHDWTTLPIATQSELALAGRAAVDAASPWVELTVLRRWRMKVGRTSIQFRDWLDREFFLRCRQVESAMRRHG